MVKICNIWVFFYVSLYKLFAFFSFLCLQLWQGQWETWGHRIGFPPDPFCVLDRWRETKEAQKPELEVVLHFCCESGGLEERIPFSVQPGELYCTPWRSTQHREEMGCLDKGHTQTQPPSLGSPLLARAWDRKAREDLRHLELVWIHPVAESLQSHLCGGSKHC